jgi:hypothetical protein
VKCLAKQFWTSASVIVTAALLSGCATGRVTLQSGYRPSRNLTTEVRNADPVKLEVVDGRTDKVLERWTDAFGNTHVNKEDAPQTPTFAGGSPRDMLEAGFRQALAATGCEISDTAQLLYQVTLKDFGWTGGMQRVGLGWWLTPFPSQPKPLPLTTTVAFDVVIKRAGRVAITREFSESVTKEGLAVPELLASAQRGLSDALTKAVEKAVEDPALVAAIERRSPAAEPVVAQQQTPPAPERTQTEKAVWQPGGPRQAWMLAVGISQYKEQTIPGLPYARGAGLFVLSHDFTLTNASAATGLAARRSF